MWYHYRNEQGKICLGRITEKKGTVVKMIASEDDNFSADFVKQSNIFYPTRPKYERTVSTNGYTFDKEENRPQRFINYDMSVWSKVDINPWFKHPNIHLDSENTQNGWIMGRMNDLSIYEIDSYCQVRVMYSYQDKLEVIWVSLHNRTEVAPFGIKTEMSQPSKPKNCYFNFSTKR